MDIRLLYLGWFLGKVFYASVNLYLESEIAFWMAV